MKKLVIFFITVIICLGASITVSAEIQPLVYWNDTIYKVDRIQPELDFVNPQLGSHEEYYDIPPIVYNENEFTLAGKIEYTVSAMKQFAATKNGTSNAFSIGTKLYYRNSDKELFIMFQQFDGKECFEHLIPMSQEDRYYCFDPVLTDISLGEGIEDCPTFALV